MISIPSFCVVPSTDHYWLLNATIPDCLLDQPAANLQRSDPTQAIPVASQPDGLVRVNLQIQSGLIAAIEPAQSIPPVASVPTIDLRGGQVWPCFVDMHTHLDKGQIWERSPNPDGSFNQAMAAIDQDASRHWDGEDLYRRMEFGLRCSYAHGTSSLRTHIDTPDDQAALRLEVFVALQQAWRDRLTLQAVCLVGLDHFVTPAGERLSDRMAAIAGVLGGVAWINPDIDAQLERVFALAHERGLDLDFHVDENNHPDSRALFHVATTALRYRAKGFTGRITCGHCCSLAVQPPAVVTETLARVREAGIGIVSLPLCNLYLQDRQPQHTPHWRGITLLHELKAAGIPVALSSDNCRDPFYGFGDHDGLEVFTQSVRIGHLDRPYGDWPRTVNRTPADLMGLPTAGRIGVGLPADLVCFRGRYYSELLSRPQSDRLVLRRGVAIDTQLPDYAELDDLILGSG